MPSSRFSLALALFALLSAAFAANNFAHATGHAGDDEYKIHSSRPASLFDSLSSMSSSSLASAVPLRPRRLLLAAADEKASESKSGDAPAATDAAGRATLPPSSPPPRTPRGPP